MTLAEVLSDLAIESAGEVLAPHWEESMALMPEGPLPMLQPSEIRRRLRFASVTPDIEPSLMATARLIDGHAASRRLFWHCVRLLYDCADYPARSSQQWPDLGHRLGELAGCFYVLVALDAVPRIQRIHQQRGIPEPITRDTCTNIRDDVERNRRFHGCWGTELHSIWWLRNLTSGGIHQVGRMQYILRPVGGSLRAFRHRQTRQVVALAGDGERFHADGRQDRHAPDELRLNGWTAKLRETRQAFIGCPISPYGYAVRRTLELPKAEWELALQPTDVVLEMHIPEGGGMTRQACRDSMQRAMEFFSQCYPDQPYVGFGCRSWIFNTQLESILPETSNLVDFMRQVYLYPLVCSGGDGLFFIFGSDEVDVASAPRDTRLQRALLSVLESGGRLRSAGMFLLTEDFARFGEQVYRRQWPPPGLTES